MSINFEAVMRLAVRTFICIALSVSSVSTHASGVVNMNDLIFNELNGTYTVTGNDPFFTINVGEGSLNQQSNHLHFDLQVNQKETLMRLFFKETNGNFDPQNTIDFTAPNTAFSLELPNNISLANKRIRIDLEQCSTCQFSLKSINLSDRTSQKTIKASKIKNGSVKIDKQSGLNINPNSWTLNDLDGQISSFTVSAADPFIASDLLDVSTQQLGGVYFKLKRPASEHHDNFQFFYATENNSFNQKYTSIVRLPPNKSSKTTSTDIELLFPLDYLSKETPHDMILKRVRLDLPVTDGHWSLLESKLIHQQQLTTLRSLIPAQIIQNKRQRLTGKALIKKVLNNLWADKLFAIFYSLLLMFVIGMFIKAYKK